MGSVTKRPKVALALGGGVARGVAHVGVLQALVEHGIPIHLVAGTSAGSLVGAMYCAGLDPAAIQRAAGSLNWRGLVRLNLRRHGLLDAEGLERFLHDTVGDLEFSHLRVPFVAVATDLISGDEVLLTEGRVSTAVRASCAFPGIFLPVQRDGLTLVDGGLVNNVPTSVARAMGADVVIAVELNRPRPGQRPPRNLLQVMLYSLTVLQRPQIASCLAMADVCIQPDLNDFGIVELERSLDMIAAGRQATEAVLPQIKAALQSTASLPPQPAEPTQAVT